MAIPMLTYDSLGFRELRRVPVTELEGEVCLLSHASGAQVMVVENQDPNRVFCAAFRTPPTNATGVEHIMEHSVLSGSQRFPLRDPFVEMLKSSLYTFLNAMTFPDRTIYPVASQNAADFSNLVRVYLDATYTPLITEDTFKREGWHYEVDGTTKSLSISGIVFNEMKGNYSNPIALLGDAVIQELFPDTFLRFDAGGDPHCIPDLTYQDFRRFHEFYYSPANSLIYLYGKDAARIALPLVREYLEMRSRVSAPESNWSYQRPFAAPRAVQRGYPVEERGGAKAFVTINWGLSQAKDPYFEMQLQVLDAILLGNEGAPLKRALIQSGLGDGIVGHGFDTGCHQIYFSIGLQGVAEGNASQVESLVLAVLDKLSREGIPAELLESALHTVEFAVREDANADDKGMRTLYRSMDYWTYGLDPITAHAFESSLVRLREDLRRTPRLFEALIIELLVTNNHRLLLTLEPKRDYLEERERKEQERIQKVSAGLSDAQRDSYEADAKRLEALATQPEDAAAVAALPQLLLKDLDPLIKRTPTEQLRWELPLLAHDLDTHGIAYLDFACNVRSLPLNLLPYAQVLARVLFGVGTKSMNFDDFSIRIATLTGGLWATLSIQPVRGSGAVDARFILHAKVLQGKVQSAFELWREALGEARLDDRARIVQLLKESRAATERRIISEGMRLAMQRAAAAFHASASITDTLGGLGAVEMLASLIKEAESDWESFEAKLVSVRESLVTSQEWLLNVTAPRSKWDPILDAAAQIVPCVGKTMRSPAEWVFTPSRSGQGLFVPSEVNYNAKAFAVPAETYRYHGSMLVLLNTLWSSWLWHRVRVQGGAYGAACTYHRDSHVFALGSYRDPHVRRTLEVFAELPNFIDQQLWSGDDIRRAVIGCIGQIDTPATAEKRGREAMYQYFSGRTEDDLQRVRDEVLGTTAEHLRGIGAVLREAQQSSCIVVLGSEECIKAQAPEISGKRLL